MWKPLARVSMQVKREEMDLHPHIYVPWHLQIVVFVLLISLPQNFCNGACVNAFLKLQSCRHSHLYLFSPFSNQSWFKQSLPTPQPQRFRRDRECSSKVPWTRASNCREKVTVWSLRTDQAGLGTYRALPIWAACLPMQIFSTAMSRNGTCPEWGTCGECSLARHRSTAIFQSGMCQV